MERLTKRVGVDEAVPICDFDICVPFKNCGYCKTGSQGFPYSKWERHCNDTCILGRMIDRLAGYEDTGLTPEEIKAITSTTELRIHREPTDAEVEELRQILRANPGILMVRVTCENEAARAERVVDYLPGDTVYDCYGMAWTVTSSEIHKFGDGPLRYLYRCGHPGTDDYCALYSDEIQPPPEAGL